MSPRRQKKIPSVDSLAAALFSKDTLRNTRLRRIVIIAIGAMLALLAVLSLALNSELEKPYYGAQTDEVFVEIPVMRTRSRLQISWSVRGSCTTGFPF